jgi:hypothetical protein
MAVTAPTALTVAATVAPPRMIALTEQNGDTTNGNKVPMTPGLRIVVRNTTAGAIGVDVFADINGAEVKLIDGSITANKAAANGISILGPFDALYGDHLSTITAGTAQSNVVLKQVSGSAGDLKFAPFISP